MVLLFKWRLIFVLPKKDGSIAMALQRVVSAHRKAFIGALKCTYLPSHLEIPHTSNFVPLLELGKSLRASYMYLSDLHVLVMPIYTSEHCMLELLQCLGETVAEPISSHVHQSCLVHRRNNRCFCN